MLKGMFVDWKETPKKEEQQNYELLKEKILMKKKKTEEEEEKTTIPHKHSVSMADQAVQFAAITTEGKHDNISRKLQTSEAAKVSGLETKIIIITKPQQVYTSVGIRHQIVTDCTGSLQRSVG